MLSGEQATQLFERMPWAALVRSLEGDHIIAVNREFERISGYSQEELLGKHPLELDLYPDEQDFHRKMTELARVGKVQDRTIVLRKRTRELFDATYSAAIVWLDRQAFILVVYRDFKPR